MQQLLIAVIDAAQDGRLGERRNDLASDQTIFPEALDRFEVPTLQVKIGFFQETSLNMLRWKSVKTLQRGFLARFDPRGGSQTRVLHLRGLRVADRKHASALDVFEGCV